MTHSRPERGLLDTSVIIDLDRLPARALPIESAISAVSLAELTVGPHTARDRQERARRQERLQRIEAAFDAMPFDVRAARAYGRVHAAVSASGRQTRRRAVDLLIAATAAAAGIPLYTRNAADFAGLDGIVEIIAV